MNDEDAKSKKEADGKQSKWHKLRQQYSSTPDNATSQRSKHGSKYSSTPDNGASQRSKHGSKKKHRHVEESSGLNLPKTDVTVEASVRSSRPVKNARSTRQKHGNDICPSEALQTSTRTIQSRRERKHAKNEPKSVIVEKTNDEEEIDVDLHLSKQICTETFGYGANFPDSLFEKPKIVECKVDPPMKVPMLKVSKHMIIYEVPQEFSTQVEIGDILYKFNDLQLKNRDEYIKELTMVARNPESQTFTFTILRAIRNKPIPKLELSDVFSRLDSPQGYEIIPMHFDYLSALLIVAPKMVLGMTIKAYNGKVYVSRIENKQSSIAYKSLLVGDAILAIENQAVSGVKETDDLLCNHFAKIKFVRLIIERPKTPAGQKHVKLALSVERTYEINPRMNEDIIEICEQQLSFMGAHQDLKPPHRILVRNHNSPRASNSRVDVARESMEIPITTDVNNITLLASTPPIPTVPPGTTGSFDPLGKRAVKERGRKSK